MDTYRDKYKTLKYLVKLRAGGKKSTKESLYDALGKYFDFSGHPPNTWNSFRAEDFQKLLSKLDPDDHKDEDLKTKFIDYINYVMDSDEAHMNSEKTKWYQWRNRVQRTDDNKITEYIIMRLDAIKDYPRVKEFANMAKRG